MITKDAVFGIAFTFSYKTSKTWLLNFCVRRAYSVYPQDKADDERIDRQAIGFRFASMRRSTSRLLYGMTVACLIISTDQTFANPNGGQVVAGDVTISSNGPRMDVIQRTDKGIVDWQGFSIDRGEHTNFSQPSPSSVTLNRVRGSDYSHIDGHLTANGRVFLINPNGVLFGPNSRVSVGGLVASTSDLPNDKFLSDHYSFNQSSTHPNASVVNQGEIRVTDGGAVVLAAPRVSNEGSIHARLGRVELAGTDTFTLDFDGDGLLSYQLGEPVTRTPVVAEGETTSLVSNKGEIFADGGIVTLSANTADAVIDQVINMEGVVQAQTVEQREGVIILFGGDEGIVSVSGSLDASGLDMGETGGTVKVLGEKVGLFTDAQVDVSGDISGGEALIGGNFQGKGPEPNSTHTYVDAKAEIKADAITEGDGGKVIVWADETTRYRGDISARAGEQGGDGGFVEVSGKQQLEFLGAAAVDAPQGQDGTVLLDPFDIVIDILDPTFVNDDYLLAGNDVIIPFELLPTDSLVFSNTALMAITGNIELQALNDITLNPGATLELLNQGTEESVVFHANNNIIINSEISTSGGSVSFLSSGILGSIDINAAITTNGGAVSLLSNENLSSININAPITSNDGPVNLTGQDINIEHVIIDGVTAADGSIDAGAGNISIITDSLSISTTNFGIPSDQQLVDISTTGDLTIQPIDLNREIVIAIPPDPGQEESKLFLDETLFSQVLTDGLNNITIGHAEGTHPINIGDITFNDPVVLRTPNGGEIDITGAISLSDPFDPLDPLDPSDPLALTLDTGGLGNVTAVNPDNDFSTISVNANNVSLTDANDIQLLTSTINGNFNLNALSGNITSPDVLTIVGNGDFSAFGQIDIAGQITIGTDSSFTATGPITLANPGNNFIGAVSLNNTSNNTVAITDVNQLTIGDSNLGSGSMTLIANGISQTGIITQEANAGLTTIDAGTGILLLNNSGNDFTGRVDMSNTGNNNIQIDDINSIQFGVVSVGSGSLTVSAPDGISVNSFTQEANAGTATFNSVQGPIDLNGSANNITGPIALFTQGAGDVTLFNNDAVVLASSNLGTGIFSVTGTGISQSGPITAAGSALFYAGLSPISLTDPANQFTGSVSLNSSGTSDIQIMNVSSLALTDSLLGAGQVLIRANDLDLTGLLQGTGSLLLQPLDGDQDIGLGDGSGSFVLSNADIQQLADGFASIQIGTSGATGQVTIENARFSDPLVIQADGLGAGIQIIDNLFGDDNASITLNGSGATTRLNGNIITRGNAITINDAVLLSADALLDTTDGGSVRGGDITLNGPLSGSNSLTVRGGFMRNQADAPLNVGELRVIPTGLSGNGAAVFGEVQGMGDRLAAQFVEVEGGGFDPDFTINGCVMGIPCEGFEERSYVEVPLNTEIPVLAQFEPISVWFQRKTMEDPRDSRYSNLGNEELWRVKQDSIVAEEE